MAKSENEQRSVIPAPVKSIYPYVKGRYQGPFTYILQAIVQEVSDKP